MTRLARRRALGWTATSLIAVGALVMTLGLASTPPGGRLASMVIALVAVLSGVAALLLRHRLPTEPDPTLPQEAQLPLEDPRSFRSVDERRRLWLLAFSVWVAGWIVGLAVAVVLDATGWVRMGVFLAVTWGSVALGAWCMRRWTGTTAWPRR